MLRIFKYEIPIDDDFEIEMHQDAKILSVQMQKEKSCIWAIVDLYNSKSIRKFRMAGTGHPIDHTLEELEFIGTFQIPEDSQTFHLFEVKG